MPCGPTSLFASVPGHLWRLGSCPLLRQVVLPHPALGYLPSGLRNIELIDLLLYLVEQLGGPGSCKPPPCYSHDILGLSPPPPAGLRHPSPLPSCRCSSRKLTHVLSALILWAAISSWGFVPSQGGSSWKEGSLPLPLLVEKLCPSQAWVRWEAKFSRKLFPPSKLLPALLSPSFLPPLKDETFETQKPRANSDFPLLPGTSLFLRDSGTKCLVATLGES